MKKLTIFLISIVLLSIVLHPATALPFASPFASPGDKVQAQNYRFGPQTAHKDKLLPAYLDPLINPWSFIFIRGSW
jgi:hypothetical protein